MYVKSSKGKTRTMGGEADKYKSDTLAFTFGPRRDGNIRRKNGTIITTNEAPHRVISSEGWKESVLEKRGGSSSSRKFGGQATPTLIRILSFTPTLALSSQPHSRTHPRPHPHPYPQHNP